MKSNIFFTLIFTCFHLTTYSQIKIDCELNSKWKKKEFKISVISNGDNKKETFEGTIPINYFQSSLDSVFDIEFSIESQSYLFKGIQREYLEKTKSLNFEINDRNPINCCLIVYINIEVIFIGGSREGLDNCKEFNKMTIVSSEEY